MNKPLGIVLAAAMTATACAQSPVAPRATGKAPRFDGGWTIGSGGKSDSTTTPASFQSTTTAAPESCTIDRSGGWTIGSGGATQPSDPCAGL